MGQRCAKVRLSGLFSKIIRLKTIFITKTFPKNCLFNSKQINFVHFYSPFKLLSVNNNFSFLFESINIFHAKADRDLFVHR
jgi:hypothetical protein